MHNIESLRSCRGCCCGARRGAYKGLVIYSKLPGARVRLHDHEQRSLIQQMKAESTIFSLYYCAGGHGHTELKIFFQNIDFPLFVPTIPPPNTTMSMTVSTHHHQESLAFNSKPTTNGRDTLPSTALKILADVAALSQPLEAEVCMPDWGCAVWYW